MYYFTFLLVYYDTLLNKIYKYNMLFIFLASTKFSGTYPVFVLQKIILHLPLIQQYFSLMNILTTLAHTQQSCSVIIITNTNNSQ